jgi:hypothetical protein
MASFDQVEPDYETPAIIISLMSSMIRLAILFAMVSLLLSE